MLGDDEELIHDQPRGLFGDDENDQWYFRCLLLKQGKTTKIPQ